ncbi:MAG: DNA-directed RNA polymerase subunit B, partial [Candidatus Bathyarchaeia archaeon]
SRSQPNLAARDLQPTHWGRLCPNETPEGSNCGLVKNLALSAVTSVGINPWLMVEKVKELGVVPHERADAGLRKDGAKVIIDGIIAGYCKNPMELCETIRRLRRSGEISPEVNVAYYSPPRKGGRPEVYINCDAGRVRRPLIVIERGKSKLTKEHVRKLLQGEIKWNDLIKNGIIEYIDSDEEENALVAIDESKINSKTTHLELTPYTILGVCASLIPYAEHNQSPRNAYESAMAKQALGTFSTNFFLRTDSRSHLLHYPQIPLVITKPMEIINYNERPSGQNCVVAVLSFQGYNMEDAIIVNKSSVERGLGRSTFFRIYEAECRQYLGGLRDKFEIPEPSIRGYRGDKYYRLLEEDGIISVEANVDGNTVLIGRTSPPRFLEEYKEFEIRGPTKRDSSVSVRPSESGIVDTVFVTESIEGSKLVKVKVRDLRIPELGDKFASRHGQKGVIGLLVREEDMPFTENGMVPDIIINPHAIPSRMTIGQFVEMIAGKIAAIKGIPVDGTPFDNEEVEDIRGTLLKLGFQHSGREVFYNGISGQKLVADVFTGIVYYQKLHHMVADKIHARARGQVQMLTRQPTEGRARGGGLRFGEMERDCLIGYGASALLKDRLLEESDKYVAIVCENCGFLAYYDAKQNRHTCRICGDKAIISPVEISYAFKLLIQELMSLGIAPRLRLEERV